MQPLLYANELLVRVRLAFQKLYLFRYLTSFEPSCKKQIDISVLCVSPLIEDKFRHKIVKVFNLSSKLGLALAALCKWATCTPQTCLSKTLFIPGIWPVSVLVIVKKQIDVSFFYASVLLSKINFVITLSKFAAELLACGSWFHSHFDNVMTQFMFDKRTLENVPKHVSLLISSFIRRITPLKVQAQLQHQLWLDRVQDKKHDT